MKRLMLYLFMLAYAGASAAQGVPFLQNFTPEDYHAHSMNFDIKTSADGTVFVANFEGLLYYDHAAWRIIHTSSVTRVTVIYRDHNDVIWAGGYNYFGRIDRKANGELYLRRVGKPDLFRGEVLEIWEKDGILQFVVNDGKLYQVKDDESITTKQLGTDASRIGLTDIIQTETIDERGEIVVLTDTTHEESIGADLKGFVKKNGGISIVNRDGRELYSLTEANGLPTDNVSWINYDGHGRIWAATESGIFSVAIPSAFSRFTDREGLKGEVLSITEYQHQKYVGTNNGLFRLVGKTFVNVPGIHHACWDLAVTEDGLLAATTDGIYRIASDGTVRQLTTSGCMALLDDGSQYYSGENDGLWLIQKTTHARRKVCHLERVTKIFRDGQGTIWLQSIYGSIWTKGIKDQSFRHYKSEGGENAMTTTLVQTGSEVKVVRLEDDEPFPFPMFSYADSTGVLWLTDYERKGLYRWKDGQRLTDLDRLLYPFRKMTIRSIFLQNDEVWLGSDDGLVVIRTGVKDPVLETVPRLFIRSITLNNDSVLWGGYGDMPESLPSLDSNDATLRFVFSLDYEALVGESVYRYQLNNGEWTSWTGNHAAVFTSLSYGNYTLKVQARDAFGRETPVVSIDFTIRYPFYMRWYMNLLYLVIIGVVIYAIFQLRMRQLERDKLRLEQVVEQRTAEVRKAQKQLIKQEKMATVGKLTQGLIDRILNPLNYINNFSKLSEGLVKDVKANIADEEEHMDKENYEDTMEVLSMLTGNLQKVGEHGQNTTRMLKAMEEMLKDRSGGVVTTDLCSILRQDEEMLNTYYARQISDCHIQTAFDYPDSPVYVKANPEQLSKVVMSLLGNSVYAVVKKVQRIACQPEITVKATTGDDSVTLVVYDTGVGIEEQIVDKIFDPFFTTKTTGEAAGIGLYLSHDIIQNYGGQITVRSVKDEFTEFTIILPIQTASAYGESD